jgi:hypothetical protein
LPGDPDLYRLFETQLSRDLIGQQGGLHHQPDQIIGQQIDPRSMQNLVNTSGRQYTIRPFQQHLNVRLDAASHPAAHRIYAATVGATPQPHLPV